MPPHLPRSEPIAPAAQRSHSGWLIVYCQSRLMNPRMFFVTLCLTVLLPPTFGETIFFDKKGGTIEDKAIILSGDEFNEKTVSRIAQEFLRSSKGKSLARLTIGPSQSAVTSVLFKVTLRPSYS